MPQVINDDGPPSNQSSPYVHSFVKTLQSAGHTVSVILPHVQRSWIGKAHFVGQLTKPTYFRPGTLHEDDGTSHQLPLPDDEGGEEWVLVDGTPATCAQLGLYHFFQDKGPVDLVISGPNYGRNSTALFSLSSGTIGGAMEAAVCRKRAVALSYAFYSRDHDPNLIAGASRHSVKLIEHLYNNWGTDVDLYSINVPLIEGIEKNKTMYTDALQNYWSSGSSFQEIEPTENDAEPDQREKEIRHQEEPSVNRKLSSQSSRQRQRNFKWTPTFTDIHKSIEQSPPGNDGWALTQGYTSVTPLKANFMHASPNVQGELKLYTSPDALGHLQSKLPRFCAFINYEDVYVQPLIPKALQSQLPLSSYTLIKEYSELPSATSSYLQITSYETLDFAHLLAHPATSLANSYIIRKALIRKHYLCNTVFTWITKHPESLLKCHVKPTVDFELDYAEFLDEALVEAYELRDSFSQNEGKYPVDREWWILKPSMSDRGQGIRLFSTEEELRSIFELWEAEQPDSDSELNSVHEEIVVPPFNPTACIIDATAPSTRADSSNGIITSQLRHFVAQPYINPPLLFPSYENRKFHIRSYVLGVGALRVYVYREMLALFAAIPYGAPGSTSTEFANGSLDLRAHLTNTCLQDGTREGSVHRFWDLPSSLPSPSSSTAFQPTRPAEDDWKSTTYQSICAATSELFLAAARTQSIHFQTLPNAFEIFGVDWMVDAQGQVWLLEVNAFPDFRQTGEDLQEVVQGLWDGVVRVAIGRFFGIGQAEDDGNEVEKEKEDREKWGMTKVLDVDLGRR